MSEADLTFTEYSKAAKVTNICPAMVGYEDVPVYELLALCGEAGEAANKAKKVLRGDHTATLEAKLHLVEELGDTLWYIDAAAKRLGFTLEEVAEININKLRGRHVRGTIQGAGDER